MTDDPTDSLGALIRERTDRDAAHARLDMPSLDTLGARVSARRRRRTTVAAGAAAAALVVAVSVAASLDPGTQAGPPVATSDPTTDREEVRTTAPTYTVEGGGTHFAYVTSPVEARLGFTDAGCPFVTRDGDGPQPVAFDSRLFITTTSDGVRRLEDADGTSWGVEGQVVRYATIVPARAADGSLASLQFADRCEVPDADLGVLAVSSRPWNEIPS